MGGRGGGVQVWYIVAMSAEAEMQPAERKKKRERE